MWNTAAVWLLLTFLGIPIRCFAADLWGGSVDISNDYMVRGISHSDHYASLQGDVHVVSRSGFIGGLLVSTARTPAELGRNVEANPYVGLAWTFAEAWASKVIAAHYAYLGGGNGASYNYSEFSADLTYQEWLNFSVAFSPDAKRYIAYLGLTRTMTQSAEVNLRADLHHALTASAGLGAEHLSGPNSSTYVYWSVGIHYDLKPTTLALSYVNTENAEASYYNAAVQNQWCATFIWRF